MAAQGPCIVVGSGTVPNDEQVSDPVEMRLLIILSCVIEHFNLIALDHPVGVGFSYGTKVNNSRTAAIDVYDFLQKYSLTSLKTHSFFRGDHMAASGKGQPGAVYIHLESMMVSNPISDATSHFTWLLQTRCYNADMYNASTCAEMLQNSPACLDSIQLAQQAPGWSVERRVAAQNTCQLLEEGNPHGTVAEDVHRCLPPIFAWTEAFCRRSDTKHTLGIPEHVEFSRFSAEVGAEFRKYGTYYVGAQDAKCAWPGFISFLKILRSPFQDEFLRISDVPRLTTQEATVRVVGKGAGNILVAEASHFVRDILFILCDFCDLVGISVFMSGIRP
ncbi:hypothetical protein B0H13DRAFT_2377945 [Mycena leptocephala]|nr:hypothetical protein B0H13DRAFT_2377945 [Mycena leptocephala]